MSTRIGRDYLSVAELSERRGVSIASIHKWIAEGEFPNAYRTGPGRNSPVRIPMSDILAFEKKMRIIK